MFIPNQAVLKRVFFLSIAGTRGGPVRLAILEMLAKNGKNINQIANEMKLDYKTVQHHMRVLERSSFVSKKMVKNENVYTLSELIKSNAEVMKTLSGRLGKDK